jgi:hypothetical protein
MTSRARCESRHGRRAAVLYNRQRRTHERMFRALEAMRPPGPTGDPFVDALRAEMYGVDRQLFRSMHITMYGPRFRTWEDRHRAKQEAP